MLQKFAIAFLLTAVPVLSAEMNVLKDVSYGESKNERQSLDIYAPKTGKNHPVIFWIHGGGWTKGDKSGIQDKPQIFTNRGFVFVSTNYRFVPNVSVKEMTGDIASAIRWTHDHAQEYGGDPSSFFVMGHSAGAHLAALVCTDDRYLKAEGLSLSIIKGCVPVDVAAFDIPKRIIDSGETLSPAFAKVFGADDGLHRTLSPVTHVSDGKSIPAFLILHVAGRRETKIQSHWFADKLKEAGVWSKVVTAEGKTHSTINSDLGLPDDKPTQELFRFLDGTR